MVSLTLESLARRVQGELLGDGQVEIRGAASIRQAGSQDVTFAVEEKHLRKLGESRAAACLIARTFQTHRVCSERPLPLILVDDPLDAILSVLDVFRPQPARSQVGISTTAWIDPTAVIGADTQVFPGAYIGAGAIIGARCEIHPGVYVGQDCRIGDDCTLYPRATLYPQVTLGDRVIVHASAVLGADGFGYRFRGGRFEKIPQRGTVLVQDDCEIGACTTIDRGMIGPTVIGEGTKLDNLVMIGHNCELGKHNVFASQVGLAGSVTTGDYVRCGGQVGVADHLHLGKGSTLSAKAGAHKDVPAGETHGGMPARPEQEQIRILMAAAKAPEMRKQLREIESQIEMLTQKLDKLTLQAAET